jgi:hypothetical protein
VLGGVEAVREVEQGGDTAVERLQCAGVVAGVHVLGAVFARDLEPHAAEVVEQGPVGADAAHRGLPGVAMGVDEAGEHQHAGRIDDLRPGHRVRSPDLRDAAVLDHDVGVFEATVTGVADQHAAPFDHQSHGRQYLRSRCFRRGPPAPPRFCA